jgi:hypothetical protein
VPSLRSGISAKASNHHLHCKTTVHCRHGCRGWIKFRKWYSYGRLQSMCDLLFFPRPRLHATQHVNERLENTRGRRNNRPKTWWTWESVGKSNCERHRRAFGVNYNASSSLGHQHRKWIHHELTSIFIWVSSRAFDEEIRLDAGMPRSMKGVRPGCEQ